VTAARGVTTVGPPGDNRPRTWPMRPHNDRGVRY